MFVISQSIEQHLYFRGLENEGNFATERAKLSLDFGTWISVDNTIWTQGEPGGLVLAIPKWRYGSVTACGLVLSEIPNDTL